jgi:hypothetical protein
MRRTSGEARAPSSQTIKATDAQELSMQSRHLALKSVLLAASAALPLLATASSHREAPFIAGMPRVDA